MEIVEKIAFERISVQIKEFSGFLWVIGFESGWFG